MCTISGNSLNSSQIPTTQSNNNLLSDDIFSVAITFLPINEFPSVSLTCRSWKKIAWNAYWHKIFDISDEIGNSKDTKLSMSASQLERLFHSTAPNDQIKLNEVMQKCNSRNVTTQINFIRNLFRSIHDSDCNKRDPRLEGLMVNLYNHSQAPIVCKMKIIDFMKSMNISILPQLKWNDNTLINGLLPKNFTPFKLETVPFNLVSKIHVHKNNCFTPGELVAIIDKAGCPLSKSTLYFGKLLNKFDNLWRIHLQLKDANEGAYLTIKASHEIGKFPEDCELPSFCTNN